MTKQQMFEEDVRSLVIKRPRLLNEIVASLRGPSFRMNTYPVESCRRWRGVRAEEVEQIMRDAGFHFRSREHGAGVAVYVSTQSFDTVIDGRGIERAVS